MLETLYNMDCLDYQGLIRKLYKKLDISLQTSYILICMLDIYKKNPNFKTKDLALATDYSTEDIEKAIMELLNLNYIQIALVMVGKKSSEVFRITPLFLQIERLLSLESNSVSENDISSMMSDIENDLKRMLTRSEMSTINSWFEEGHSIEEVIMAIDKYKNSKRSYRISDIDKELNRISSSDSKPNEQIMKAFELMGR